MLRVQKRSSPSEVEVLIRPLPIILSNLVTKPRTAVMPLSLQKVVPSDLPTIIDVHFAAFQQSDPLHRIIYPLGPTPSVLAYSLASAEKAFHEPQTNYLKVVDSSHVSEEVHLPLAEYGHV